MDGFSKLIRGCDHFCAELRDEDKAHYQELANGQSPDTLIISCSDSRVMPTSFTQASAGDLFVIRNAGNIVPCCDNKAASADLGTIEFASEVLGVKHIVVCGHSDCGAVKAMMNKDSVNSFTYLKDWIHASGEGLELDPEKPVVENVKLNALHQVSRLKALPFVKERLSKGDLQLHAWVFSIGTASIETYSFESEQWGPLLEGIGAADSSSEVSA